MHRSYSRCGAVLVVGLTALGARADVTARQPLIAPEFSIDLNSPEVLGALLAAGDVLVPPGPGLPTLLIPAGNLSLVDPMDELDGLSTTDPAPDLGARIGPGGPRGCVACEPGDVLEGEPDCFDGAIDLFNGGCDGPLPSFSPIACGQSLCGRSGTFSDLDGRPTRDSDWYSFSVGEPVMIRVTAQADFALALSLIAGTCDAPDVLESASTPACAPITIERCLQPGGYNIVVSTRASSGVPCGAEYRVSLSCGPCVLTQETFAILFSVTRDSHGQAPPEPALVALGFPFNVLDQAQKNQAAGDAFLSLLRFTTTGPIPPGRSLAFNNTLVIGHGDAGGVDFVVDPDLVSPEVILPPGTPIGGVDAGMGTKTSAALNGIEPGTGPGGANGPRGPAPHPPFFFSVTRESPALGTTLPGISGADIFLDTNPAAPGGEVPYAQSLALGLTPDDDIDALIVFDNGDLIYQPSADIVIFSLDRESPSLGGFGPADLFRTNGPGFNLYCPAQSLGLLPSDDVDMLDWIECDDILACVQDWAIGFVCQCAGDTDCDNDVDLADLAGLLSRFGACAGETGYAGNFDLSYDYCIDLSDLAMLLSNFGNTCP